MRKIISYVIGIHETRSFFLSFFYVRVREEMSSKERTNERSLILLSETCIDCRLISLKERDNFVRFIYFLLKKKGRITTIKMIRHVQ